MGSRPHRINVEGLVSHKRGLSMSNIHNSNIVFRCPISLKAKMRAFAEANDQHLSNFIRTACIDALRREMPLYQTNIPTEADIKSCLEGVVK
jgi:hypothetical protein